MSVYQERRLEQRFQGSDGTAGMIGDLLGDVTHDLATLIRQELELARAEARKSVKRAGFGIGILGGSSVAAVLALLFLSVAGWWAMGSQIGEGWSALIVGVCWGVIAAVLAAVGRRQMHEVIALPKTAETLRRIPDAVRGREDEY
jgi:hypothetical protein